MKKTFLLLVAFCFVCAISLFVTATHVFDERSARPVFGKQITQPHTRETPRFFKR
jgi:hypothetical protein